MGAPTLNRIRPNVRPSLGIIFRGTWLRIRRVPTDEEFRNVSDRNLAFTCERVRIICTRAKMVHERNKADLRSNLGTNDLSARKRVPSIQITRPLMGV